MLVFSENPVKLIPTLSPAQGCLGGGGCRCSAFRALWFLVPPLPFQGDQRARNVHTREGLAQSTPDYESRQDYQEAG